MRNYSATYAPSSAREASIAVVVRLRTVPLKSGHLLDPRKRQWE